MVVLRELHLMIGSSGKLANMDSSQMWCVTLLTPKRCDSGSKVEDQESERFIASTSEAIARWGGSDLTSYNWTTLPEGSVAHAARLTFSIGGSALPSLQAQLGALANHGCDLLLHDPSEHWTNYKLTVFDLDSTLIRCEVIDQLAAMMGVGDRVAQITESAMRGEIDFSQSFRRRISLLKGLEEDRVFDFAQCIELTSGATVLIRSLKRAGYRTAIASGGFTFVASRLQRELGIDDYLANTLDIADGRATGEITTTIVDGDAKAAFLLSLAAQQGISPPEVIAIGDGANDIPMLQAAGLGIAYRAKPRVLASARYGLSHVGLDGLLYVLQLDALRLAQI